MKNPFIPVDVDNPSCYQNIQIKLQGEGVKERKELSGKLEVENPDGSIDKEILESYYRLLCDDIKKQRKRIGGDWAVCDVGLISENLRNYVKYISR